MVCTVIRFPRIVGRPLQTAGSMVILPSSSSIRDSLMRMLSLPLSGSSPTAPNRGFDCGTKHSTALQWDVHSVHTREVADRQGSIFSVLSVLSVVLIQAPSRGKAPTTNHGGHGEHGERTMIFLRALRGRSQPSLPPPRFMLSSMAWRSSESSSRMALVSSIMECSTDFRRSSWRCAESAPP